MVSGEVSGEPIFFIFFSETNRFLLQSFAAGGDFLLPEMFFLLHANLTVKMVDPTAGDPGAGESDPPGDAQHFPFTIGNLTVLQLSLVI